MTTPLAKYVRADVSPERVGRLWQGISARLARPAPRRSRFAVTALLGATIALGAGAAAAFVLSARPATESSFQNAALETASGPLALDLRDGSRLELRPDTRVEVAESDARSVRLELRRGALTCDVRPDAARRFAVLARGVEVRVTGTRFSVALSGERVDVHVERGSVEVVPPSAAEPRRLAAGERWSLGAEKPAAPAPKSPDDRGATSELARVLPDAGAREASPRSAAPDPESARELFDRGNAARRAGDVASATRAYELLLENHPADARAGLAAFELGRLRMDRLGNFAGAVQALERAIRLAPGSGFREDALARLVAAHDALGASERCRAARQGYLASYPRGVHAASVAEKCKSRP